MGKTKIEWVTDVWNPVTGCTKISEGCKNCYAERMAKRLHGRYGYPNERPFDVTLHHDRLGLPASWKKPRRIFVNSMSDLFHDDVPFEFVDEVLRTAIATPRHTYMILTKRAERMAAFFKEFADRGYVGSPVLWFGVTVENQAQVEKRIPFLYQVPAAVKFVSVEPMLGQINLTGYLSRRRGPLLPRSFLLWASTRLIDWIICGPETGPGARPFDPAWARDLRDQCQSVVVPFFYKGKEPPKDLKIHEVPYMQS